jgi:hypothetical protein
MIPIVIQVTFKTYILIVYALITYIEFRDRIIRDTPKY